MAEVEHLCDHVPESCRDLLELSSTELRSAIPELARDKGRMGEVEQAVKSLPSHHDLHQADARDLRFVEDESGPPRSDEPAVLQSQRLRERHRRRGSVGGY